MAAASFNGRVSGLAVALGVGAAALAGTPTAWADGDANDNPSRTAGESTSAEPAHSAPQRARAGAGSRARQSTTQSNASIPSDSTTRATPSTTNRQLRKPQDDAVEPVTPSSEPPADRQQDQVLSAPVAPAATAPTVTQAAPVPTARPLEAARPTPAAALAVQPTTATPATAAAPVAPTHPAPTPAASVSGLGSGLLGLLDALTGGTPGTPSEAPLAWATLAATRRGTLANATSASASLFTNSISVNPEVDWQEGLLLGTLNATSSRDLPLSLEVIAKPSLGGKITWAPDTDGVRTDRFSYLPYMTTLSDPAQNETFSVMVSEITAFDAFLKKIPIIGRLWEPVLKTLHRMPIVSTLLAPLIGSSLITEFNENPSSLADGRPVGFTYLMPSWDKIKISLNYFPAINVANGTVESAPTVLNGPDLGFPGNTDVFSDWDTSLVNIVPGLIALRNDASPLEGGYSGGGGYNVITWDPRGEWASEGYMQLDNPNFEGRDVSSIISFMTSQASPAHDQLKADETGDPFIGMVGGSYGGGIQLAVAGTPDKRVDAIVPSIAWNTLNDALYPNANFKTMIGGELLLALAVTNARLNKQIYDGILSGVLLGGLSDPSRALLINSGPGVFVNNITAPALFLQGTPDILFELSAAMTNAQTIATANPTVPVKTTWFCGGHGVCLLSSDLQHQQGAVNMDNTLMWLDQYVAGNGTPADSIPTFQWFDQTGQYHSSDLSPFDPAFNKPTDLGYSGDGGSLLLVPLVGGSGPSQAAVPPEKPTVFSTAFALASGSKAWNALNLDVAPPVGSVIAGAPKLEFSYRGLGTSHAVYAQLVDNATGQVVGNIVTPVTVLLDGRDRKVSIPMADIAYTVNSPGDSLTLQITSSALPYADALTWGFINIGDVKLAIPTVA